MRKNYDVNSLPHCQQCKTKELGRHLNKEIDDIRNTNSASYLPQKAHSVVTGSQRLSDDYTYNLNEVR